MGLPKYKRNKNNINAYPDKQGAERVDELMANTDFKSTFLPKSIRIEDIDIAFQELIKNGDLKLNLEFYSNLPEVPLIFMNTERWSLFAKTWAFTDENKNIGFPFLVVRQVEIAKGTYLGNSSHIPQNKTFNYVKVPTYKDQILGYDIYKIPQPTPIDIVYEIRFFTKYTRDKNRFYELYFKRFGSLQSYIFINGHPFAVLLEDEIGDEDSLDINSERIIVKIVKLRVTAYLQDENDFEKVEAVKRVITMGEISGEAVFHNIENKKD